MTMPLYNVTVANSEVSPNRIHFETNHLSNVVYKLDFINPVDVTEEKMKEFKIELGGTYTELADVEQIGFMVNADFEALETTGSITKTKIWKIESVDKTHHIEVDERSLSIVITKYDHFPTLKQIASKAESTFVKVFNYSDDIARMGLRYINQIPRLNKETKWDQLIVKPLVAHLEFGDTSSISRSMHTTIFNYGPPYRVTFNYGIFNDSFPAIVDNSLNEYILDLDAYTTDSIAISATGSYLDELNTTLTQIFFDSITEKLKQMLGVLHD